MNRLSEYVCPALLLTTAVIAVAPGARAAETVTTTTTAEATTTDKAASGTTDATVPASSIYNAGEMTVISERDKAGLLELEPNDLLFGLNKSLQETPRAASFVSDTTLERYGIQTVDDLIATSPGTYTSSFYGVSGSVNVRGTLAETYYRGFKRIENRGTYETPVGAASRIDIIRGAPTPNFGPGKVGGLLNFEPKTTKLEDGTYMSDLTSAFDLTVGSYGKKNLAAEAGAPITLGEVKGGAYLYAELEDSDSYYDGIHPKHQMAQLATNFNFANGWSTATGGMVYHAEGYVQTPGWNRVTQDLIDNGTYITGRDTSLTDANGDGDLDPSEITTPNGSLTNGGYGGVGDAATLDTGVGKTQLSRHTVYVSDADFSETWTATLYHDFVKAFSDGSELKFQFFYDSLENERFVSYGYPGAYDSWVGEGRVTYNFSLQPKGTGITIDNSIGGGYRHYDANAKESFNSGRIAVDRRDLSYGATPTDIMDSPFTADGGQDWETDISTKWGDAGIFAISDIKYGMLDLTLGGRYDHYNVETVDDGSLNWSYPLGQDFDGRAGRFTYSASLMLITDLGINPYVTHAKTSAVEIGQAGEVSPSLVINDAWISDGKLNEVGVKFSLFDAVVTGTLDAYRQERTRFAQISNTVVGTVAKGVELEARYLATENLSFTFAGNLQKTTIKGPDTSYYIVPCSVYGYTDPTQYYGGACASYNGVAGLDQTGNYEDGTIPQSTTSLFGTYTTDKYDWGQAGGTLGATHVTSTTGKITGVSVKYPAYTLVQASAFYALGNVQVSLNVDNIFDETYFTPLADLYSDAAVLPGKGREWRLSLKYTF